MAEVLKVQRIGPVEVPPPRYQTAGSAGLDLCAALMVPRTIQPGARELIPTGYAVELPFGCEGQIRPRSGLALHHGITVLNTPGTLDEDFRGELAVLLVNLGDEPFTVEPLTRIAQLVVARYERVGVEIVDELSSTVRGDGGYGSTGR